MVGFLGVTLLMPVIRRYALGKGLQDQPGARRLHKSAIARGGGASIVLVMLTAMFVTQPWGNSTIFLLASFILCGLTGWLDDHRPVSPLLKLLLLSVVAIATIISLEPSNLIAIIMPMIVDKPVFYWLAITLLVITLLWVINLFNFMDGSNGLTVTQALSACFAIIIFAQPVADLNTLCWLLAGALLAFLPWNFPRPSIFLGDVGSLSLGLLVGWFLFGYVVNGALQPLQALLVISVFLVDASATLMMRMLQGDTWYKPHTKHAYQCLVRYGWSHTLVCFVYLALNLLLVYPTLWMTTQWPEQTATIVAGCFLLLTLLWSIVQLLTAGVSDSGN